MISPETYGEWPDYVEDVVSGVIWLQDPFCPGPDDVWVRDPVPYNSSSTGLTWWKYTRKENENN